MASLPLRSELPVLFGEIEQLPEGGYKWEEEGLNMVLVNFPSRLKPLGVVRTYCNRVMAWPLRQALDCIVERGLIGEIVSYDGCFQVRKQRGDLHQLSVHSWGLAVDFNAAENKIGTMGDMSAELVACFEDAGFVWGGRWARPDPMHFQYVTED